MGDRSATTAKDLDVVRSAFSQKANNFGEELDVTAVVTRDADGAHVFLDCGAYDVAYRTMITKVNDFNAVPDEFQVDRVDRAVMPVANRDCGQNSNR